MWLECISTSIRFILIRWSHFSPSTSPKPSAALALMDQQDRAHPYISRWKLEAGGFSWWAGSCVGLWHMESVRGG